MELLIRGGRVVTPQRSFSADILVRDGKFAQIGEGLPAEGCPVYDASGCLLFPGFIDAHTHLQMDNGVTVTADDFASGTAAALCGGTTTILDFATQDRGDTLAHALETWHRRADGHCSCDYGFHMAIVDWNPAVSREVAALAEAGVTSFKLYLAYDNLRVSDRQVYEVLKRVGEVHGIVGAHCENGDLVNALVAGYLSQGKRTPDYHPLSRPDFVEAEAVSRYCYLATAAGVPVHIVHLSTRLGLEEARRARSRGQRVYLETCPQYLTLEDSVYSRGFESAKFVCSPPIRKPADRAALWQAVSQGEIDSVSTDHCSFNLRGQKELGREDFSKIPNGMPGLEHRPAVIYTHGVTQGRITENQMAALLAENAARLFGLYPRKGVIAPGSDADLVVWDPAARWTITARTQHHRCDNTPYEGMEMRGRAKAVFLRGRLAAENGEPVHTGLGVYIPRGESEYF